ncbi:MAG: biotin transporter BioY [Cyanobacteria bacterium REEB65]|nr:biotin transporter BioY [Cyanobacteria bacterium REEB65]
MIALLWVLLAATFTALGSFIPLPVPFLTLGAAVLPEAHEWLHWRALSVGWCSLSWQVPSVWIAAMLLGARRGLSSQLLVILLGLAGLPIFAGGGGLAYTAQPTFGYLLGLLPLVVIAGSRAHKGPRKLLFGLALGQGVMWAIGWVWQVAALHGLGNPDSWLGSVRGTLQLAPSYALLMAVLVGVRSLLPLSGTF